MRVAPEQFITVSTSLLIAWTGCPERCASCQHLPFRRVPAISRGMELSGLATSISVMETTASSSLVEAPHWNGKRGTLIEELYFDQATGPAAKRCTICPTVDVSRLPLQSEANRRGRLFPIPTAQPFRPYPACSRAGEGRVRAHAYVENWRWTRRLQVR